MTSPARRSSAGRPTVRRPMRLPRAGASFLDIFSAARAGPPGSIHFTPAQVEQILRTVRRSPEVMVKVTSGATRRGAVASHLSYISRKGELEIETDEGERIGKKGQQALLRDWHLELSPGQYRKAQDGRPPPRAVKLTHNIVLSRPKPMPPRTARAAVKALG